MRFPATTPPGRDRYTRREWSLIQKLNTPLAVQRFLEALPYNREERRETLRSFRAVVREGTAHCLEGALTGAALLEHHGYPPLLLDLESHDRLDHVLFLFRQNGRYGTVAVSRDPGLHGRTPSYRSLHGLVMSYYDPYIDATGRVTGYGVLDLRTIRADWRFSTRNVWSVQEILSAMPHRPLRVPRERYRKWKRRFDAFVREHPDGRPTYYPSRKRWL